MQRANVSLQQLIFSSWLFLLPCDHLYNLPAEKQQNWSLEFLHFMRLHKSDISIARSHENNNKQECMNFCIFGGLRGWWDSLLLTTVSALHLTQARISPHGILTNTISMFFYWTQSLQSPHNYFYNYDLIKLTSCKCKDLWSSCFLLFSGCFWSA